MDNELRHTFQDMFGTVPHDFQIKAARHLLNGRNVIIQAPTGAGKTRAALYPFLENLSRYSVEDYRPDAPLPLTCRYAVPMRVLATQFEREFRDYFTATSRSMTELNRRYHDKLDLELPAIQTGETPNDPGFESPLTFCTIDQLLASFIGTPYSLSFRQANLNVGAVVGSYLILDEFHLYPLDTGGGARLTALAMLRLLKGLCRFVLMTATFSTPLVNELAELLDAKVVRVEGEDELAAIMQGRQRVVRRAEAAMTPEAIWAAHAAARERGAAASLVVCNTVGRAQDIYLRLKEALRGRDTLARTRIELLHSRFTPKHRREKSALVETWLGKDQWHDGRYVGRDTIVIGTQVVEVGLNISAGVLHTEVAPASSVIQRAGRCARFAGQQGEVIVYPLESPDEKAESLGDKREASATSALYLPYDRAICERTWDALAAAVHGPFGFNEEQTLIDAVHTEEDSTFLSRFHQGKTQLKEFIKDTLTSHKSDQATKLIRDVATVSVLIHRTPDEAITTRPFDWEAFSLRPSTLYKSVTWNALQRRAQTLGLPWMMKELVPGGDLKEEADNDREQPYNWRIVSWDLNAARKQIDGALRLVLPPDLAAYDQELGFRLLLAEQDTPVHRAWESSPMETKRVRKGFAPREQRSYVEHITGLMHAYDWSVHRELAWVASRLEAGLNVPAGSVDLAIRLAIACHDIGKLGDDWQRWAHATQEALKQRYGGRYDVRPGREFLAKTDGLPPWRWQEEKDVQDGLRKRGIARPPHAGAGVAAGALLITKRLLLDTEPLQQQAIGSVMRAALSAIARHHTPTAATYDAISWRDAASMRDVLAQAFAACRVDADLDDLDLQARPGGQISADRLVAPEFSDPVKQLETWLGFTLVRALRLCDQRAERK